MAINFLAVIMVNVVFMNQYALVFNTRGITDPEYPPFCNHDSIDKDFKQVFKNLYNGVENLVESIQFFIFIPTIVTICVILVRSKSYMIKLEADVKLLLITYFDTT